MNEEEARQWPQHAKLLAPLPEPITKTSELSQKLGEFLDWLKGQGIQLMVWRDLGGLDGETLVSEQRGTTALLADYFKIDDMALDREKRQMLTILREGHSAAMAQKLEELRDAERG